MSQKAEYWEMMNVLFEGITLVSFIECLYYFFIFSELFFIFLTLIFWFRAKQMANNYVSNIVDVSKELNYKLKKGI